MMFWTLLTASALGAGAWIAWPFLRPATTEAGDSTMSVYRDQMQEVARDQQAGLISAQEATAATAEIERRALHSARLAGPVAQSSGPSPKAALTLTALAGVAGLALYAGLGTPEANDSPLAARGTEILQMQAASGDLPSQVKLLAVAADESPDNLNRWVELAGAQMLVGDYANAAIAWGKAAELAPERSDFLSAQAEALTFANNDRVGEDARAIFERLAADHGDPRARYYLALAEAQNRNFDAALTRWTALLNDAKPGESWVPMVRRDIAQAAGLLGRDLMQILPDATETELKLARGEAPGNDLLPTQEGLTVSDSSGAAAAIADLPKEEQEELVAAMVSGLEARLQEEPDDLKGWIMLVRSFAAMERPEKAQRAYETALGVFADDPQSLAQLKQIAGSMLGAN